MVCIFGNNTTKNCRFCTVLYCPLRPCENTVTMNNIDIFSITAKESEQLENEYEINDIIVNLDKALSKVGNVTILEAIKQLKGQTRFADELDNKLNIKTLL